jgi:hypothetical protein
VNLAVFDGWENLPVNFGLRPNSRNTIARGSLVMASLPPMTLEDIAVMTKSAAATRTLDIPAGIYFTAPVDHFPHLEKLRLDFVHPNHVRWFPDVPGINVSYTCLELSF